MIAFGSLQDKLRQNFVGGTWIDSTSASTIPVVNPATEEVIAEVAGGSRADADLAVAAAREAFPGWSTTPPAERGKYIAAMGEALHERADELAATVTSELGVPGHLALATQVANPISKFARYAELAETFAWEEHDGASRLVRAPVGVALAISPWNFPLNQAADKIAPALLAGCPVILKPSEMTPMTTLAFADAAKDAGIPPGVFNLVNGAGATAGEALASHPGVDAISFTGSTAIGKHVAALAAERVARVTLELGGKSPAILLDDADLEEAIPAAVKACFLNSGQVCVALSRLLVPLTRYQEAVERAQEVAGRYTVGDPGTRVDLGPLASSTQRDRVLGSIARGIEQGARLITGGVDRPPGLAKGYYVRPTVFADVESWMDIAQQEIFGPVLSIIGYRDDEDAVRIANDTPYGLTGCIWSRDIDRANRVARRLRLGLVRLNGASDPNAPFGGFKQSGIGREHGRYGLEEFLEWQAIVG
jgi:acyl-CoA reductase-like NAD-dependent aldehyde dehydrogenase